MTTANADWLQQLVVLSSGGQVAQDGNDVDEVWIDGRKVWPDAGLAEADVIGAMPTATGTHGGRIDPGVLRKLLDGAGGASISHIGDRAFTGSSASFTDSTLQVPTSDAASALLVSVTGATAFYLIPIAAMDALSAASVGDDPQSTGNHIALDIVGFDFTIGMTTNRDLLYAILISGANTLSVYQLNFGGVEGRDGEDAWYPSAWTIVSVGEERHLRISGWSGGEGNPPPVITIPVDVRGPRGERGIQGVAGTDGAQGEQGVKGDKGDAGTPGADTGWSPFFAMRRLIYPIGSVNPSDRKSALRLAGWLRSGSDNSMPPSTTGPAPDNNPLYIGADAAGGGNDRMHLVEFPDNPATNETNRGRFDIIADFRGAQGIQGPQGLQGEQGIQGRQGERGATGAASDIAGPQGERGERGLKGDTGERGLTGQQGIQGIQGIQGRTGASGQPGAPGAAGLYPSGWSVITPSDAPNERRFRITSWSRAPSVGTPGALTLAGDIRGPAGADGADSTVAGPDGDAGWSPRFSVRTPTGRPDVRAMYLEGYVGGEGDAPSLPTNRWVGATGNYTTAANAADIRGAAGPAGAKGDGGDVVDVTIASGSGISVSFNTSAKTMILNSSALNARVTALENPAPSE